MTITQGHIDSYKYVLTRLHRDVITEILRDYELRTDPPLTEFEMKWMELAKEELDRRKSDAPSQ